MKKYLQTFLLLASLWATTCSYAQNERFSDNLSYGGNIGLNFGDSFFSVMVAPSVLYRFNEYLAAGPSLIYSYVKQNDYKTSMYGGSWIVLTDPIDFLQLSAELEQLRVNRSGLNLERNFWNTALFVGAGLRTGNMVVGLRYNILHTRNDQVYAQAYQPFVRVYF